MARCYSCNLDSSRPCTVTQVKSVETDGYNAVQVAFGEGKNLSKAVAGHVKSSKISPKYIREFRVDEPGDDLKVGDAIDVSAFALGDLVRRHGHHQKVKGLPVR
jgi:large subunit ribosomal protein L3